MKLLARLWRKWWFHVDWVGAVLVASITMLLFAVLPISPEPGWLFRGFLWFCFNLLIHAVAILDDKMPR